MVRADLITAVEQAADGIVVADTYGTIQYVNPAFTSMTGYSSEDAVGHNPRILKSGRQPDAFYAELWSTIRSGRVWQGEVINRRKDGTFYHEEMKVAPVEDSNGQVTGFIAIKRDVTERDAAEEARRALAAIVENSPEAIIASTPAGLILSWNHGAEDLFGYGAGERIGKHVSTLVSPETEPELNCLREKAAQGHIVSQYESFCRRKDGREVPISITVSPVSNTAGEVVAISAMLCDISARREAEKAQALLAAIVESSDDAIFSVNLEEIVVSWNRGAELMFGYSRQEVLGQSVTIFALPGRGDAIRLLFASSSKGQSTSPFETTLQGHAGVKIDAHISISPIRGKGGTTMGVSAIARDIGMRLQSEQKLQESDERFRRVFESAPFGMCVAALDGRILQANAALCEIVGYSAAELLATAWGELAHPDDPGPSLQRMEQLLEIPGACVEAEKRYIHRNGTVVWGRARAALARDRNGHPLYIVIHIEDITERKRAASALAESEERFRIMADGCPAIMWVTDAQGAVRFINRACREFCGVSYKEAEGNKWKVLLHPEDASEYTEQLRRAVEGHGAFHAEVRIRRFDGEWRWVSCSAEPRLGPAGEYLGHVGISPDVTDRKLAQQSLQFQLSLISAIHEGSLDGILAVDDRNMVVSHNTKLLDILRISMPAVPDSVFDGAPTPDSPVLSAFLATVKHPEQFLKRVQEIYADTSVIDQCEIELKDGRTLERYTTSMRSVKREYLGRVWFFRDITERKQAEEAVRSSEQRLRGITDCAQDAILMMDPDGLISYWNPAAASMFGYTQEEAIGKNLHLLLVSEHYRDAYLLAFPEFLRTGQGNALGRTVDLKGRRKNGLVIEISLSLSAISVKNEWHAIGIIRDVTQAKQAELALQLSEEKFRQLAENIREVFWMMSPAADEMLYVSPAYEQMWGRSCDSLYHNPASWMEAIHPDDREPAHLRFKRQIQGESLDSEYRIRMPDGKEKWIRDQAFAIRDQSGQVIRVVGIAEDITERQHYQAQLIDARVGADAANLAKSCFLANMSHEIRTPMNGILGMIQLLVDTELTAKQRRYIEVAQTSGSGLLVLIDNVLDLSKIEAGKVEIERLNFDIRGTVEKTIDVLRGRASDKGIRIHSQVSSSIPPLLRGDAHRLGQVMTNLVANAIKFTEQGEVALHVEMVDQTGGSVTLRFDVTDTGVGIRPELASQLFSPFVQADVSTTRKYGGTGLGLAISKQLVELMGGKIGFESREGEGSTFWFSAHFEAAQEAIPAARLKPASAPPTRCSTDDLSKVRILVAEDNPTNREVALAQLENLGYKADAVTNGKEAMEAIAKGEYSLVLMDCEMPLMDGYQATRHIRASSTPSIPIVAMTAHAMSGTAEKCLSAGMNDFLSKPVDLRRLGEVLAKWCPVSSLEGADLTSERVASNNDEPIFNAAELLARLMDDRGLARIILNGFIADFPFQLTNLRKQFANRDAPGARRCAHTLKGSAATVAATRLSATGMEMERAADAEDLDRFGELLPAVVTEFQQFRDTLQHTVWIELKGDERS